MKRPLTIALDYNVSFFITTKGYPSFLLELPDFIGYNIKFIAITTQGQLAKNTSNTSKIGQTTYSNKNNDGDNNDKYQFRRYMEIYLGH